MLKGDMWTIKRQHLDVVDQYLRRIWDKMDPDEALRSMEYEIATEIHPSHYNKHRYISAWRPFY